MKITKTYLIILAAVLFLLCVCTRSAIDAANSADIKLPEPIKNGGPTLNEALLKRSTYRSSQLLNELNLDEISNLLWSADGINRPNGKRTAPTALNRQEITLYILTSKGAYKYDPVENMLLFVTSQDLRSAVGAKYKKANLIVISADLAKQPEQWAAVDCGFVGQNIYLYAASNNFGAVFMGSFDKNKLEKGLKLKGKNEVLFVQVIGKKAPSKE